MDLSEAIQRYHSTECSAVFSPPSNIPSRTFYGIGPALDHLADRSHEIEPRELIIHRPAGDLSVSGQSLRHLIGEYARSGRGAA